MNQKVSFLFNTHHENLLWQYKGNMKTQLHDIDVYEEDNEEISKLNTFIRNVTAIYYDKSFNS